MRQIGWSERVGESRACLFTALTCTARGYGYAYADSNPLTTSDPIGQMLPAGGRWHHPSHSTTHHTSHARGWCLPFP
jgi:hypothetical protein